MRGRNGSAFTQRAADPSDGRGDCYDKVSLDDFLKDCAGNPMKGCRKLRIKFVSAETVQVLRHGAAMRWSTLTAR